MIIIISSAFSQKRDWQGSGMTGSISGLVLDSLSQKPIEYTSISVISQKTGEIENGGVTDETGKFKIREIPPGRYEIKVEFIGYHTTTIPKVFLKPKDKLNVDLGTIKLKPKIIQMEEISVIDDRPIFEFETDKLIYNSSDDIISDSGTAEDVLNKVPMVTVDQDGEVSLRGNPNVRILVNGRPNRTGHESNNVDNIPASIIDKVEVITSPSAKYDPEGMAGIINIVLKKGKYEGLNGTLKLNGRKNNNHSVEDLNGFTAYGNFKGEKWNVYSSYSLNNRIRRVDGHREVVTTFINSTEENIYFTFDDETENIVHSIQFGSDYSVNENLILNGELNYRTFGHKGEEEEINFYDDESIYVPQGIPLIGEEIDFGDNFNLDGNFEIKKTYENPDREMKFSFGHVIKKHNEYEILQETEIDTTSFSDSFNTTEIDFSYKLPINDKSKFEFGYDGILNNNTEDMDFEVEEFSGLNSYTYNRAIHGIFLEYEQVLNDKFSIKPSVRYEYVNKEIKYNSITEGESDIIYAVILDSLPETNNFSDEYDTFYPDLHFTYNISKKSSLQFGLSKRVNRPGSRGHGGGSRQIRPFPRDVYSENFLFIGNPFLRPEFSTQYDLSYRSPIPMGFASVNLYYHQLTDVIEWYDDDKFPNSDVLTFRNADTGENMGIEAFTMIMGQTFGGGYNLNKLEDPSGDYELNGNSKMLKLYSRINLPAEYIKLFDFEFGFYYMKFTVPGGDLFGKKGTIWANTGISKSFLDESLSISFGIRNLFNSGGFQLTQTKPLYDDNGVKYADEYTDVDTNRGGRTFTVNLKFYFGKMQEEKRKNRRIQNGNDNEMMDMGY